MYYFFGQLQKKVWSPKRGRFVSKAQQQTDQMAENLRDYEIGMRIADRLGYVRNPKRHTFLYMNHEQGYLKADGSWMTLEQVGEIREQVALEYDSQLKTKIETGTAIAAIVGGVATITAVCCISAATLGIFAFVAGLIWLVGYGLTVGE